MHSQTIVPIALSSILWLATQAATVVVALMVVLPRRALAAWLMLASAGMSVLGMAIGWVLPVYVARMFGASDFMTWNAWMRVGLTVWGAIGWALFLYGLVELCRRFPPAPPAARSGAVPGGPA